MPYRLFLGPLNSIKNIKAFFHSLDTFFGDAENARAQGQDPELYGHAVTYGDQFEAQSSPTCPPENPCIGCTLTPTPTPTVTPTITSTITPQPTPTRTTTPQPTQSSTPAPSYFIPQSFKIIP